MKVDGCDIPFQVEIDETWLFLTQPMDPEIKSLNFFFPTKHVIPESLKFSHWLSEVLGDSKYVCICMVVYLIEWPSTPYDDPPSNAVSLKDFCDMFQKSKTSKTSSMSQLLLVNTPPSPSFPYASFYPHLPSKLAKN